MSNIIEKLNLKIEEKFIKMNIKNMEEKDITYVFGKNGVGKTTYSRNFKNIENFYVYNSDFIVDNVFIDNEKNGGVSTSQTPNAKKKTFSLFFGEKISILINKEKELTSTRAELKDKIEKMIGAGWLIDEKDFLKSININLPTIDSLKKTTSLEKIKSEEIVEMKSKISSIKNLDFEQSSITKFNFLIDMLCVLNENIEKINKIIIETPKEENDVINLHKVARNLNRDFKFVNNKITMHELNSYLENIITEKSNYVIVANKNLSNLKKATSIFLNEYKNSDNLNIALLVEKVENINIESICEYDSFVTVPYENIKNIPEKLNNLNILEMKNYILEKFSNPFSMIKADIKNDYFEYLDIIKEIKDVRDSKINSLKVSSEKLNIKINSLIAHFRISGIEVEFKPENISGEEGKATFNIKTEKNIQTLSEGEKKIFALAYFLAYLEEKINSNANDIVVIMDDPFDSNDHTKSSYFKQISFEYDNNTLISLPKLKDEYKKKTGKKFKLIILTHNLNVLFELTSSLMIKDDKKRMFYSCKNSDSIEIREWTKNEIDNLKVDEIFNSTRSFFPDEEVIENVAWNDFIYSLCDIKSNPNEIRLLLHFLLRMNYRKDFKKRNKIKNLIANKSFGERYNPFDAKNMLSSLISACNENEEKIISENCLIVYDKLNEISNLNVLTSKTSSYEIKYLDKLKEYDFDKEEIDILNKYLERYSIVINKAIESNDILLLQRLRHKDYLSSTLAAFGLNEI